VSHIALEGHAALTKGINASSWLPDGLSPKQLRELWRGEKCGED
jgi:hypothetical protein